MAALKMSDVELKLEDEMSEENEEEEEDTLVWLLLENDL